ncbi:MAG: cupin domain-containing protein [Thermoplasmatales archaeon]|nr:MAG: cupin domain-containing protein [Thermoplasmatales archaeon]
MILKERNAKKRKFLGISYYVLAFGEKSMITRMNYKAGEYVPFHCHPNEQTGYIVSGKIRIRFSKYDEILHVGDSYSIPCEIEHIIEGLEDSTILDFFCPPRQDYL